MGMLPFSRSDSARAAFDFPAPRLIVGAAFRGPMECVRFDLRKRPAHGSAARIGAVLHDVLALRTSDLLREEIRGGIVPKDAPGVEVGVVNAQGRAKPIACA